MNRQDDEELDTLLERYDAELAGRPNRAEMARLQAKDDAEQKADRDFDHLVREVLRPALEQAGPGLEKYHHQYSISEYTESLERDGRTLPVPVIEMQLSLATSLDRPTENPLRPKIRFRHLPGQIAVHVEKHVVTRTGQDDTVIVDRVDLPAVNGEMVRRELAGLLRRSMYPAHRA